jgi:hypothetical protein
MRTLRDFKCENCGELVEKLVDTNLRVIDCPNVMVSALSSLVCRQFALRVCLARSPVLTTSGHKFAKTTHVLKQKESEYLLILCYK